MQVQLLEPMGQINLMNIFHEGLLPELKTKVNLQEMSSLMELLEKSKKVERKRLQQELINKKINHPNHAHNLKSNQRKTSTTTTGT